MPALLMIVCFMCFAFSSVKTYKAKKLAIVFKKEIITPGIRFKDESIGDQKRTMTPKQAFKNGATALVMGRSILKGKIKQNIQRLIQELK